jgi:peptide/nickel transport system permease protein
MSAIADTTVVAIPDSPAAHRPTGRLLRTALGLWRTRIGLILVGILVAIAVFGRFLAPHGPTAFVGQPNTRPGDLWFGTDHLGQDVWSRFLWGGAQLLVVATLGPFRDSLPAEVPAVVLIDEIDAAMLKK